MNFLFLGADLIVPVLFSAQIYEMEVRHCGILSIVRNMIYILFKDIISHRHYIFKYFVHFYNIIFKIIMQNQ